MRSMALIFWHTVPRVECDTRPRVVYRDEVKPKYFKVEIYLWLATVTWIKYPYLLFKVINLLLSIEYNIAYNILEKNYVQ